MSLQGILFLILHYSYFMSWYIDIKYTHSESPESSYFSIVPIRSRKMKNQSKVSGPELNHDYISYSDIKIRYR